MRDRANHCFSAFAVWGLLVVISVIVENPCRAQAVQVLQARSGSSANRQQAEVPRKVDRSDNTRRSLILTPIGPLVIEFRITIDGRPFRELLESMVDDVMKDADTDGDGKATYAEAFSNPRFLFGRMVYLQRGNDSQRRAIRQFADLDKDGNLNRYEARVLLSRYQNLNDLSISYQRTTRVAGQPASVRGIIDADANGRISREEWTAATDYLKTHDINDNDVLELSEVQGTTRSGAYNALVAQRTTAGSAMQGRVYSLTTPPEQLVYVYRALEKAYGLHDAAREPSHLTKLFVAAMDANDSGELELDEMPNLGKLQPSLILDVVLNRPAAGRPGSHQIKLLKASDGLQLDQAEGLSSRQMTLSMPGLKIQVVGQNNVIQGRFAAAAQSLITRFDANKNGYLEKKELEATAQYARLFSSFDTDGDGKAFPKEITEFYDRNQRPSLDRMSIQFVEENNAVFAILDSNGDRRLGLREMHEAPQRLQSFDVNEDGQLTQDELPQAVKCSIIRGTGYGSYALSSGTRIARAPANRNANSSGPNWFVRMDRNGDGDVSRREFPGDAAQFGQLDKNKDGFIERREAESAK